MKEFDKWIEDKGLITAEMAWKAALEWALSIEGTGWDYTEDWEMVRKELND